MNQLDALTAINKEDLVASFGWDIRSPAARLLQKIFHRPAQRFALQMAKFDSLIDECGLPEASRLLQRQYVKDVRVYGLERLPPGPILVLSNHPGMTDTTSIFAALGRADLKVIALPRPFLTAMPNMSRHLFFVMEDHAAPTSLIRQASKHLQDCGAVLSFPAGHIEPDPDLDESAVDSLATWNASAGLFLRNAPETVIVPILVRSTVWKKAAHSPLLLLKRSQREKEKMAAALQLLAMVVFGIRPVTVRIQIGEPIYPVAKTRVGSASVLHQAVLDELRHLIEKAPEGSGESVL